MTGRVALVSGGSSGIGLATARALFAAGVQVAIVARRSDRLDAARRELLAMAPGGDEARVLALSVDVSDRVATERMARDVVAHFGCIDILVHAAGVLRATLRGFTPCTEIPRAEWDGVLAANLRGSYLTLRAVLPHMIAAGSGDVLHVSSRTGLGGLAFDGPYAASKFAARGMLDAWAEEVAEHGIRVQGLAPGAFKTELLEQAGTPSRGLPPAERVAETILAMLSMPRGVVLEAPIVEGALSRGAPGRRKGARLSSVALTDAWTRAAST